MSPLLNAVLAVSLIGLVALTTVYYVQRRQLGSYVVHLVLIALCVSWLNAAFGFPRPDTLASRGDGGSEVGIVVVLFVFMVAGMLAHWLHDWLATPRRKRPRFDAGTFIAPILASPIVFIPLLASLQNADLASNRLDTPRLMMFLVAFQNGFFWKEYFDNRRSQIAKE